MPCYHPLRGFRAPHPNANGKFGFVFDRSGAAVIPCGKCVGCRLDRSRQWAIRCVHEASLYDSNCFVTLTYSDENLPPFGSLRKSDLQKFFKRLRKRFGAGIRFYACGEYGEQLGRPHFHACIFNFDFLDKVLWTVRDDVKLFTSRELDLLWPFGFSSTGDVTYQSAAYVARYVMKKISGSSSEAHYTRLVPETGELVSIPSEFTVMSRRPGIGKAWYDRYGDTDVHGVDDFVVHHGQKYKIPRYYDLQLEHSDIDAFQKLKIGRYESSIKTRPNCTPERLKVRETITLFRISNLRRSLK